MTDTEAVKTDTTSSEPELRTLYEDIASLAREMPRSRPPDSVVLGSQILMSLIGGAKPSRSAAKALFDAIEKSATGPTPANQRILLEIAASCVKYAVEMPKRDAEGGFIVQLPDDDHRQKSLRHTLECIDRGTPYAAPEVIPFLITAHYLLEKLLEHGEVSAFAAARDLLRRYDNDPAIAGAFQACSAELLDYCHGWLPASHPLFGHFVVLR